MNWEPVTGNKTGHQFNTKLTKFIKQQLMNTITQFPASPEYEQNKRKIVHHPDAIHLNPTRLQRIHPNTSAVRKGMKVYHHTAAHAL